MVKIVCKEDSLYPERLRNLKWPPPALFCEGDVSLLKNDKNIAVVGTRRMTEYGRRVTQEFVRELVKKGYCIVSGLARGVDRVAHETALKYKGPTLAVLAHGLQMTYPREHEGLRKRIVEQGGLVVTEQPTGEGLTKQRLALRNRIVVGLSQSVLVTESPKSSGTKITVGWAAEQGKDVYVVPGPITDLTYEGSVEIIRDGGIPVTNANEIFDQA